MTEQNIPAFNETLEVLRNWPGPSVAGLMVEQSVEVTLQKNEQLAREPDDDVALANALLATLGANVLAEEGLEETYTLSASQLSYLATLAVGLGRRFRQKQQGGGVQWQ